MMFRDDSRTSSHRYHTRRPGVGVEFDGHILFILHEFGDHGVVPEYLIFYLVRSNSELLDVLVGERLPPLAALLSELHEPRGGNFALVVAECVEEVFPEADVFGRDCQYPISDWHNQNSVSEIFIAAFLVKSLLSQPSSQLLPLSLYNRALVLGS